jgi:hypothetical protein
LELLLAGSGQARRPLGEALELAYPFRKPLLEPRLELRCQRFERVDRPLEREGEKRQVRDAVRLDRPHQVIVNGRDLELSFLQRHEKCHGLAQP